MGDSHLNAPPRPRFRLTLSGQLLTVTLWFALGLQALTFVPALTTYREQWVEQRLEDAQLLARAFQISDMSPAGVSQLLDKAEITSIRVVHDDETQMVFQTRRRVPDSATVDVRDYAYMQSLTETFQVLWAPPGRYLRLVSYTTLDDAKMLEVMVPEHDLRVGLWGYAARVAGMGTVISIVFALLVYWALSRMFVRPLLRLNRAMRRFRLGPDQADNVITPSKRQDELGRAEHELEHLQTEVQRALGERRRLAALGEAVAKIAHDLRNMLATAQLSVDRLSASADPKVANPAKRLARSISRASGLAEAAMTYGKAEEPKPEPKSLAVKAVMEQAADDAGLNGACQLKLGAGQALKLYVDPDQAHRVFLNLMKNARQAGATQLEIKAKLARRDDEEGGVSEGLDITVSDNGPGIPEKLRDRLFQPFSGSTRDDGFGLGLSIVRELVELNRGEIHLLHTHKAGTAFQIWLPTVGSEADVPQRPEGAAVT